MHRILVLILLPAIFIFACSGDGKCPSGSECTQIDCSCTDVKCDLYSSDNGIKVFYLVIEGDQITQYTATIAITTKDINPVEGHEYTGAEIDNGLVTLDCPATNCEANLVTTKSHCKIDKYGGANGQLSGSCTFIFSYTNYGELNAYMPFNCTLKPATTQRLTCLSGNNPANPACTKGCEAKAKIKM